MRSTPLRPCRDYRFAVILSILVPGWVLLARVPAVAGESGSPAQSAPAAATSPAGNDKPPTSSSESVEERFKRMEESYRRMEESNRRIQSQYNMLLEKFDLISSELARTRTATTNPPVTRASQIQASDEVAGLVPAPDDLKQADEPGVSLEPLEGSAVEDFISPFFQPPGAGAEGRIRRGSPFDDLRDTQLPSTESRMDQIGAGAQGTGAGPTPGSNPLAASFLRPPLLTQTRPPLGDRDWIESEQALKGRGDVSVLISNPLRWGAAAQ